MKKRITALVLVLVMVVGALPMTAGAAENDLPFTDVATHWGKNAIEWVYAQGLFGGTSDTKFSPNGKMSRAMLATVLWRLAGKPADSGNSVFTDVPAGTYYTEAVHWASNNWIVAGTGGGKFSPEQNVTREQITIMLYRYASSKGDVSGTADISAYPDAGEVGKSAQTAIRWAVGNGIITGKSGRLDPKGSATRAEVATMIMRFAG